MLSDRQFPPVMILGCGRSGTSILGELFDGLGGYTYYSEPAFADVLEYPTNHNIAVKVPTESAGFPADRGLSFPLDVLFKHQPDTVLLWIVRHPLDAICSLRVGIENNWGHHPRPPDWRAWLQQPLLERCAHHWAFINQYGYARVAQQALLLRFEDMISQPRHFAAQVCSHIGVKPDEHKSILTTWSRRVQDSNNQQFVEAQTSRNYSRPDHSRRVGRWQENLSAEEARRASSLVASANEHFGYQLQT